MATLDDFKQYARLPPDDSFDKTAEVCFEAATQAAQDAGIPEFLKFDNDAKYNLYVYALALYWYENRGFMPIGAQNEETRKIMNQMRFELKYRRDNRGDLDG